MEVQTLEGQVAINIASASQLEEVVTSRFRDGQGFSLATINLDHVVKLGRELEFATAYRKQDIVVADGHPLVWFSRLAKRPVNLLQGAALIEPLAKLAARNGVPVALIGSTEETLEKVTLILKRQFPDLQIVATISPPMGFDPHSDAAHKILVEVDARGARFAFVALGAPKQEILAARGRALVPSVSFASIGAGLDYIAGTQRRAPEWVQALALEWLWRVLHSPFRLSGRYARCFAVLPRLLCDTIRLRNSSNG